STIWESSSVDNASKMTTSSRRFRNSGLKVACTTPITASRFSCSLRAGSAPDSLGQLAALLVSHVPGRCTDQPGHRVLLAVLAHVDADDGALIVEQELGERLGQLGLAHSGGPEEQERSGGPVWVGDASACS